MYFIEKMAVFSHGIWWYGEELEEGLKALRRMADADEDDYHEYILIQFVTNQNSSVADPIHDSIAYTRKNKELMFKLKED